MPLIPSVLSFGLGVAWTSWRASSSEIAAQLNDLLKDIKQLEDLATDYWTVDFGEGSKIIEVKMRGLTFAIAGYEDSVEALFHRRGKAYLESVDRLIEQCTGGGFETSDRKADFPRAIAVRGCASSTSSLIRRARQDSAGIIAFIWQVREWASAARRSSVKSLNELTTLVLLPYEWSKRKLLPLF